jgi:hypothetical protein
MIAETKAAARKKAAAAPRFNAGDAPVLVLASATFPGLRLLRGSSDVVRARITKASIACQDIASAVAVFERVILAVPMHVILLLTCVSIRESRSTASPTPNRL